MAWYEAFFQGAACLPSKKSNYDGFAIHPQAILSSSPWRGACVQVIYVLWPAQEGTRVPQHCISSSKLNPIKLWPSDWKGGILGLSFSQLRVIFHLHHPPHNLSALWEWKGQTWDDPAPLQLACCSWDWTRMWSFLIWLPQFVSNAAWALLIASSEEIATCCCSMVHLAWGMAF